MIKSGLLVWSVVKGRIHLSYKLKCCSAENGAKLYTVLRPCNAKAEYLREFSPAKFKIKTN